MSTEVQSIESTEGSGPPPLNRPPVGMAQTPPVRYREMVAVLLLVVLADLTLYRGYGFAGYAALFLGAPLLLCLGAPRLSLGKGLVCVSLMLLLLVAKLIWCGSWLLVVSGFALLTAFAMTLSGLCPYVIETIVYALQTVVAGFMGLVSYLRSANKLSGAKVTRGFFLNFGLPLLALVVFGLLFIVANPDLRTFVGEKIEWIFSSLWDWIFQYMPSWLEILFWGVVAMIAIGLLRPIVVHMLRAKQPDATDPASEATSAWVESFWYASFRNTLLAVIVLFAVYLVFEFITMWARSFPEGFYYSGYAHQGAAWLTIALALATAVLSLIFRGEVLYDPRLGRLRWLAWIWSLENGLLAIAVYHRMFIYIGFNGMTRMRMVGFFGMSCVVAGFVLVLFKIIQNRDFIWLMRCHLWALVLTVFFYALTPVDLLVHGYNTRRIMSGDPAPSIQISVHPICAEGATMLIPLTECDNPKIREGIRAMLAACLDRMEARARQQDKQGWTTYQIADRILLERLRAERAHWAEYTNPGAQNAAIKDFRTYSYQWY